LKYLIAFFTRPDIIILELLLNSLQNLNQNSFIDKNYKEVAKLLEADGKYEEAGHFFFECGNTLKSSQCALKLIRISLLDESFLPSKEIDRKALARLNDSCAGFGDGSSMSRNEDASTQFELFLLKRHSSFKIDDLHDLKRRAEASSNPLRLMIIAMRLWLRNAEGLGLKSDQKGL
jgi:hypothetical protein